MIRALLILSLAFLPGTALADVTKGGFGAENPNAAEAGPENTPAQTKRNSYPFHGTLASIDASGKKLTLAGKKKPRVILLAADTRFFRSGAKTKIEDVRAGERVTGTVRKNEAGEEVAISVRYGGTSARRK